MGAQQQAQQAEYELQKQETLAKAAVAKATGEAQSVLVKAKAESEANRLLQQSMSATLVQYRSVEKWNGVLPEVTGGVVPFIDVKPKAKGGE
jgi:regulator of protease activity HflC (stomatin/prohibitin superfamily)